MSVVIDRPSTWVKFQNAKQCDGCFAGCCTLPVETSAADLIRLGVLSEDDAAVSLKKAFRRLHKEGIVRSFHAPTQLFILEQRRGRDCVYLHPETRLCTVYEKRPEVCRRFPKIGPRPGYCPKQKNRPDRA
jgi:Fe-S-cluster containining protein